ncbi:MAG: Hpt domain-containing protein [Synergistales bacterium]|nr:Hpt domain-containing protein [Synergistales bacterium]
MTLAEEGKEWDGGVDGNGGTERSSGDQPDEGTRVSPSEGTASAGPSTERAIFDESLLLEQQGGDRGFVAILKSETARRLRECRDTITEALNERDGSDVHDIAHALKGIALTVALPRLAESAERLMGLSKARAAEMDDRLYEACRRFLGDIDSALRALDADRSGQSRGADEAGDLRNP